MLTWKRDCAQGLLESNRRYSEQDSRRRWRCELMEGRESARPCSVQLAEPLMRALFDEIEWATEDEPTEEKRRHFVFDHYLVVTRVCRDTAADKHKDAAGTSGSGASRNKQVRTHSPLVGADATRLLGGHTMPAVLGNPGVC